MSLLRVTKTDKYKTISFLGMKFNLVRTRYQKWLKKNPNLPYADQLRTDGLSLVGNWDETSGESQVGKDFVKAIAKAGIQFDKINVVDSKFFFSDETKFYPRYKNKITFTTGEHFKSSKYNNISVLFWEFESGCLEIRPYLFDGIQKAIVFSDFDLKYFQSIAPKGVEIVKLSYPFDFDNKPTEQSVETRKRYGIKDSDFLCFYNFSYYSSYKRKNAEGILEAFAKAFKNISNVKLIIKSQGSEFFKDEKFLDQIKFYEKIKSLGLEDQVIVIDKLVSRDDMFNLMNCCDVYVSLHRGEGLGLGMLEAMSMGKPVIATNYGGNTDFVREGVAFPIDYTLVEPKEVNFSAYRFVQKWAEPNIDQASETLRQLYENPTLRAEIGNKAKAFVAEKYSLDNFVKSLVALQTPPQQAGTPLNLSGENTMKEMLK